MVIYYRFALVRAHYVFMATTREKPRTDVLLRAALLEQSRVCIDFNAQITTKVNQIFSGKLFEDELEKLSSSISALLMNGERHGAHLTRASENQRAAALAVLDDPRLLELLRTRPTTMWEELIIEKMTAAQLLVQRTASLENNRD